jgi:uroporphyrinogen-III decarboxylase
MVDMYDRPDQLLTVMEKLVPIAVKMALDPARDSGHPIIGFMLHKGADGFMSPEQFKTFYWPPLKKVMLGLIEAGFVPLLLCEGSYTSRLETIADIPRGKCIYWFENVDWAKAKAILGDTACIRGGVPASILFTGTTQQMKDCIKQLIDVVGKGGGLIVDCGLWFDEARHENVKTMVEFTKEYGVY